MSFSYNPYQQKLIELNKDLEGFKLDLACLNYDLEEYSKFPVSSVSIEEIKAQIENVENFILKTKQNICKVSKLV